MVHEAVGHGRPAGSLRGAAFDLHQWSGAAGLSARRAEAASRRCRADVHRASDGGDAAESALAQVTSRRPTPPTFSQRELQVLAEVREGLRNREIAARLGISQPGVRFHLANIYRKTGVNRREEAVRSAQSLGVLD